ncbi:uncharacterized protein si:ch211-151h10.2 [Lampris incognitus]|uniref:uncharacterized protein si:ch211-151h10.2 n=1 Tax=Lampris incognitus TaxID=2546036 RepID=UPI0024B4CFE3|nr:uncharacterized protein si:ch211-151h10.2 [Lampris incognitus]
MVSRERPPGAWVPLTHALADGLLLCVLQEPLTDPGPAHIEALLTRLESVSDTLERADVLSEPWPEGVHQQEADSLLRDKVKLLSTYLQQRTRLLRRLVQVHGEFEASIKDTLEGLECLWAQLEELHTRVTLTKEWSQGHGDLSTARAEAEDLSAVLDQYRNKLRCCQAHHRDSTRILQVRVSLRERGKT